ncbi:protein Tob1-like isoform X1 [Nilaparvata lugens]|uniref:protein Tob1-like isoform X1 n=1 Tax=Nilaparvata lugens TaxID=108931 RepID=UPI00193CA16E|nr:protein Tob1-like isoform X1 [Nilaparvata lugens]
MHLEVQVALNFVISYLYNKLPRRRVNIFGEELEKALKEKFVGHWYPDKPFKGSAFRCLKTGDPVDAVLERAAKESGVPVQDILENLPSELAVWVDPGEVSYRIGEKGAVKVLFSESDTSLYHHLHHSHHNAHAHAHHGITSADVSACLASLVGDDSAGNDQKTFNPEAQCFRPIDNCPTTDDTSGLSSGVVGALSSALGSTAGSGAPSPQPTRTPPSPAPNQAFVGGPQQHSPVSRGVGGGAAPLTFTTATFAQTKFGSTKLKTNSKRANRMSPTEFSNYIKQRALQQAGLHHGGPAAGGVNSPIRSLSPASGANHSASDYYYHYPHHNWGAPHHPYTPPYAPETTPYYTQGAGAQMAAGGPQGTPGGPQSGSAPSQQPPQAPLDKQLVDFGLSSQFQHLLVAN